MKMQASNCKKRFYSIKRALKRCSETSQKNNSLSKDEMSVQISKIISLIWESENSAEEVKHIVWNLAVYLYGYIDEEHTIRNRHYSPLHRHFFFCLLEKLYKKRAGMLLQLIDRHLNVEHLLENINLHPISSEINMNFKIRNEYSKVDFIKFVKYMKNNPLEFKDYSKLCEEPLILSERNSRRHIEHKVSFNFKKNILLQADSVISIMKRDILATYECLTPGVQNGKHIVIAISGFLSEEDDNKKQWENLINNYPDLPVYSYTWKASK
jgi:hypothetical protein